MNRNLEEKEREEMSWNTYYVGAQTAVVVALGVINNNCGFPKGGTDTWGNAVAAYPPNDFWYILMPPPGGYTFPDGTNIPQNVMISGVSGVSQAQSNSSWWPPPNPPSGSSSTGVGGSGGGLDFKSNIIEDYMKGGERPVGAKSGAKK